MLKVEGFDAAMNSKDYEKAIDIAESVGLKKVKDNNFLCLVADAYEALHRYDDAKKVLLMAYENTNAGRHLAYRLCLISVKTKEFDEAMEFYEDFIEMAPRDTSRYILKYKMAKAKNAPVEKLIKILEEYVNIDMEEKWAYELAKLYHMAGDTEKCVDMCDEISLWFSKGKYVAKAMELKSIYKPLTACQEAIKREESEPEEILDVPDFSEIKVEPVETDKFNTMDIQEVIAEGMKDVIVAEETNIHEGQQATKIAPDFVKTEDVEPDQKESINPDEVQEITGVIEEIDEIEKSDLEAVEGDKTEENVEIEEAEEKVEEPEVEPIKDIQGVEDILRQLQARGILKAETVEQAVNIIDEAGKSNEVEEKPVSTMERWAEDSAEEEPAPEIAESEKEDEPEKEEVAAEVEVESEKEEAEAKVESNTKKEEPEVMSDSKIEEIEAETKISENEISENELEKTAEIKIAEDIVDELPKGGVPIFDLDFNVPEREATPITNETEETNKTEETKEAVSDEETSKLHSDKELSVDVEILSGTDWKQDETTRKPMENKIIPELAEKKEEAEIKETPAEKIMPIMKSAKVPEEAVAEPKEMPELTDEELSAFKNYLNVEGFASNIKEVLQELIVNYTPNGKSTDGNVIIMGDEKTGKTTLAIETIKLVNKKRGRRNRKLAKVDAAALNRRGFRNSLNKLLGSDLIIENAHNLGAMTLSEVIDASGMFTDDMLIVLEGETEQMEKMLEESSRLSNVFNHIVRIKEYDIKEWVEYGKKYAADQGYKMDELANLAFFKAIDDFFGTNKGIGQSDVETIIDDAIKKSGRIGRKLSGMFSSKKEEDGLNTLVESDFHIK